MTLPALQGVRGGCAFDVFTFSGHARVWIDDLTIAPLR